MIFRSGTLAHSMIPVDDIRQGISFIELDWRIGKIREKALFNLRKMGYNEEDI